MASGRHLVLTRHQILAYRRAANGLARREPHSPEALRRAAWAGLQDSMPRAAVLSLHARVEGTTANAWAHSSLVQLWGPRFSAYAVAAEDRALFSLGRLPAGGAQRRRAEALADRLHEWLGGREVPYSEAGHALGVPPNSLRYVATTGTLLIRWDGARRPTVWTVPRPEVDPRLAQVELARRHLHIFGPATAESFALWAGVPGTAARATYNALADSLIPVRTPIGDATILAEDEARFRAPIEPVTGVRLLPSGDAYFLLHASDRELLLPEKQWRDALWTSRVWPRAVMLAGELVGTWRRSERDLSVQPWVPLSPAEKEAIEAEALSMPLPGERDSIHVRWTE